jgi:hypothetical protein
MKIDLTPKEAFDLWESLPDGHAIKEKLKVALSSDQLADNHSVFIEYLTGKSWSRHMLIPSSFYVQHPDRIVGTFLPEGTKWRRRK